MNIKSKLTILRIGGYNFRSLGKYGEEEPFHVVDFTTMTNTLIVSEDNGSGKSTLYKHLIDYCLTGKNSVDGDNVDALINSANKKQGMLTFIEWHFAGNTYRSDRGRGKTKVFDISKLIDDEWILIPDLPVKDSERQNLLYSLTGLDKNNAESVIEATMVLGVEKFKSFISLKTQDKRDIFEPIFGCTEFSQWNETAKAERTKVILEQKQVGLEITNMDLKFALSGQGVEHKKQEISTLITSYEERTEVLGEKLSKCIDDIKLTSEVDTSGLDLDKIHSKEHHSLCWELESLKIKLEEDIAALGEFEIDVEDKVLVKLNNNLLSLDKDLSLTKKALDDKRKTLDGEVVTIISNTNKAIEDEEIIYKEQVRLLEKEQEAVLGKAKILVETNTTLVETEETNYQESVLLHKQCEDKVLFLSTELAEFLVKETQYKEKCDKLLEAAVYLNVKKEQEEDNLSGLVHAGECPTCKKSLSEDYITNLKEGINVKIYKLEEDIGIYKERITAGESKINELQIGVLSGNLSTATLKCDQTKPDDSILGEAKRSLQEAMDSLVFSAKYDCTERITSTHNTKMYQLSSVLSGAERKVKDILGDLEATYNHLVKSTPLSRENVLQQIEDRKISLRGEHAGKEKNLKGVYEHAVANINYKIKCLDDKLKYDLKELVTDKEDSLLLLNKNKCDIEGDIKALLDNHTTKLASLQKDYDASLAEQFCKASDLLSLNKKHDVLQDDIEDWHNVLLMISDKEGKSDVISYYLVDLNRNINKYLNALNMFIDVKVDNLLNITMNDDTRDGQTLNSLSVGQKARVNCAIMLALRDVASSRNGMECNVLVLDEILGNFSEQGTIEVVSMLKEKFSELNLIVISQNKTSYSELFEDVREYALRGGFTVEIDSE